MWNLHTPTYRNQPKQTFFFINIEPNELENHERAYSFFNQLQHVVEEKGELKDTETKVLGSNYLE